MNPAHPEQLTLELEDAIQDATRATQGLSVHSPGWPAYEAALDRQERAAERVREITRRIAEARAEEGAAEHGSGEDRPERSRALRARLTGNAK